MFNYTIKDIEKRQVYITSDSTKKFLQGIKNEIEAKYGINHVSRDDIIDQIIAFF